MRSATTATHDLTLAAELTRTARILGENHQLLATGCTPALLADTALLRHANLISQRSQPTYFSPETSL
ncbi:hypothetical protein [Armatimonas sp.]|uniref:hypothetical protein n=1 Tax=Armatimonas sp. TaxID=1872638 RepID=UPI00374D7B3B